LSRSACRRHRSRDNVRRSTDDDRSCSEILVDRSPSRRPPTRRHGDTTADTEHLASNSIEETSERTDVSIKGVHPMGGGERTGTLRRNLMGEKGKNPGSTNKHKEFGQLIIRNIVKIIATGYHILRLNAPISRRLSVRSFVRPFVSYTESV